MIRKYRKQKKRIMTIAKRGHYMDKEKLGHLVKLPINAIDEDISVEPIVQCPKSELLIVLQDLKFAVNRMDYVSATPTEENPALSDDYIFDTGDQNIILNDLNEVNFVGKIKDIGKGAKKRLAKGLPQEYLYVFKYPCRLQRRDADYSGIDNENVLIYIKINDRKIPYEDKVHIMV